MFPAPSPPPLLRALQLSHVMTVTRVDPQQDTLMGVSGLLDGVAPTAEEGLVFSFGEFAAVRVACQPHASTSRFVPPPPSCSL